jgi:hypothetical protein
VFTPKRFVRNQMFDLFLLHINKPLPMILAVITGAVVLLILLYVMTTNTKPTYRLQISNPRVLGDDGISRKPPENKTSPPPPPENKEQPPENIASIKQLLIIRTALLQGMMVFDEPEFKENLLEIHVSQEMRDEIGKCLNDYESKLNDVRSGSPIKSVKKNLNSDFLKTNQAIPTHSISDVMQSISNNKSKSQHKTPPPQMQLMTRDNQSSLFSSASRARSTVTKNLDQDLSRTASYSVSDTATSQRSTVNQKISDQLINIGDNLLEFMLETVKPIIRTQIKDINVILGLQEDFNDLENFELDISTIQVDSDVFYGISARICTFAELSSIQLENVLQQHRGNVIILHDDTLKECNDYLTDIKDYYLPEDKLLISFLGNYDDIDILHTTDDINKKNVSIDDHNRIEFGMIYNLLRYFEASYLAMSVGLKNKLSEQPPPDDSYIKKLLVLRRALYNAAYNINHDKISQYQDVDLPQQVKQTLIKQISDVLLQTPSISRHFTDSDNFTKALKLRSFGSTSKSLDFSSASNPSVKDTPVASFTFPDLAVSHDDELELEDVDSFMRDVLEGEKRAIINHFKLINILLGLAEENHAMKFKLDKNNVQYDDDYFTKTADSICGIVDSLRVLVEITLEQHKNRVITLNNEDKKGLDNLLYKIKNQWSPGSTLLQTLFQNLQALQVFTETADSNIISVNLKIIPEYNQNSITRVYYEIEAILSDLINVYEIFKKSRQTPGSSGSSDSSGSSGSSGSSPKPPDKPNFFDKLKIDQGKNKPIMGLGGGGGGANLGGGATQLVVFQKNIWDNVFSQDIVTSTGQVNNENQQSIITQLQNVTLLKLDGSDLSMGMFFEDLNTYLQEIWIKHGGMGLDTNFIKIDGKQFIINDLSQYLSNDFFANYWSQMTAMIPAEQINNDQINIHDNNLTNLEIKITDIKYNFNFVDMVKLFVKSFINSNRDRIKEAFEKTFKEKKLPKFSDHELIIDPENEAPQQPPSENITKEQFENLQKNLSEQINNIQNLIGNTRDLDQMIADYATRYAEDKISIDMLNDQIKKIEEDRDTQIKEIEEDRDTQIKKIEKESQDREAEIKKESLDREAKIEQESQDRDAQLKIIHEESQKKIEKLHEQITNQKSALFARCNKYHEQMQKEAKLIDKCKDIGFEDIKEENDLQANIRIIAENQQKLHECTYSIVNSVATNLQDEIKEQEETIKTQGQDIIEKQIENDRNNQELTKITADNLNYINMLNEEANKHAKTQIEIETLKQQLKDANRNISDLNNDYLITYNNKLRNVLSTTKNTTLQGNADIQELGTIDTDKEVKENIETTVSNVKKISESLLAVLTGSEAKFADLVETKQKELKEQYEQKKITSDEALKAQFAKQIQDCETEKTKAIQEKQEAIQAKETEKTRAIQEKEKEIEDLRAEHAKQKEDRTNLTTEKETLKKQIEQTEQELKVAKGHHATIQAQLTKKQKQLEQKEAEILTLKEEQTEHDKALEALQDTVKEKEKELKAALGVVEQKQNELNELKEQLTKLNERISEMDTRLHKCQEELYKLRSNQEHIDCSRSNCNNTSGSLENCFYKLLGGQIDHAVLLDHSKIQQQVDVIVKILPNHGGEPDTGLASKLNNLINTPEYHDTNRITTYQDKLGIKKEVDEFITTKIVPNLAKEKNTIPLPSKWLLYIWYMLIKINQGTSEQLQQKKDGEYWYTFNHFREKFPDQQRQKQELYKCVYVVEAVNILYGFLMNPFQVIVGVLNVCEKDKDKKHKYKCTPIDNLICDGTNKPCVTKTITLTETPLRKYTFDNFYLPKNTDEAYPNLHRVPELDALIQRFRDAKDKNFMLLNYGYSGTGKTFTAKNIIRHIYEHNKRSIRIQKFAIYGKKLTYLIEDQIFSFGGFTHAVIPLDDGIFSEEKKQNEQKDIDRVPKFSDTILLNCLSESKLYKPSLNNPESSRFHLLYKITHANTDNKSVLYFYDLAGFEHPMSIIKEGINDKDMKKNITAKQFTDELSENSTILLLWLKKKFVPYDTLFGIDINFARYTKERILMSYIFKDEIKKYTNRTDFVKEVKKRENQRRYLDKLDLVLESYFIIKSLDELKEQLGKFKVNDKHKIDCKYFNLPKGIEFEKIVMFGYLRADKGYRHLENDDTFLNGTIATCDFLHTLYNPVEAHMIQLERQQTHSRLASPRPASPRSSRPPSPRHLKTRGARQSDDDPQVSSSALMHAGNTLAEDGITYLSNGGGILDKSVIDTDRALLIAITFIITVMAMYMKKVIVEKGYFDKKDKGVMLLLSLFGTFTLLYVSIVQLETIDTMYVVIYVLLFAIVNIIINMCQLDKGSENALILDVIKQERNSQDILVQYNSQHEYNLLLTWAFMSTAVIFI